MAALLAVKLFNLILDCEFLLVFFLLQEGEGMYATTLLSCKMPVQLQLLSLLHPLFWITFLGSMFISYL